MEKIFSFFKKYIYYILILILLLSVFKKNNEKFSGLCYTHSPNCYDDEKCLKYVNLDSCEELYKSVQENNFGFYYEGTCCKCGKPENKNQENKIKEQVYERCGDVFEEIKSKKEEDELNDKIDRLKSDTQNNINKIKKKLNHINTSPYYGLINNNMKWELEVDEDFLQKSIEEVRKLENEQEAISKIAEHAEKIYFYKKYQNNELIKKQSSFPGFKPDDNDVFLDDTFKRDLNQIFIWLNEALYINEYKY